VGRTGRIVGVTEAVGFSYTGRKKVHGLARYRLIVRGFFIWHIHCLIHGSRGGRPGAVSGPCEASHLERGDQQFDQSLFFSQ